MRVDIYGDPKGNRKAFERALRAQCRQLGIELNTVAAGDLAAAVSVVFAEHGVDWSSLDLDTFADLACRDRRVLPVIDVAANATRIPSALTKYNAFLTSPWRTGWPTGLVDEVLSHAWLRRRERKVFVSYKRTDSAALANRLYDELTRHGYVTFLDDVSIDKGTDFQSDLKWWLNDADLLLVLLSPNFTSSKWCLEEIAFARSRSIGLLAVEWPDSVYAQKMTRVFPGAAAGSLRPSVLQATDPDQRLQLREKDLEGLRDDPLCDRPLSPIGMERLLTACARQRSLAIRQRLEDLIPLAHEMLDAEDSFQSSEELGDFKFTDKLNRRCFVRVLPFRPDPKALWDACRKAKGEDVGGCFYSECDKVDERARALRWLANRPHEEAGMAAHSQLWACLGDEILP
ncbi:TIR domain-containing protein [Variovorax sp. CF079]|uniref:toll/interleukin-1 receptor domain-containing protein n=1 Tax=Variovorax sp. CF079 TaxID=1882774 RepID=UPI000882F943|nr:toll/interleukin-1 receptor domain-containing protein [Variovorax sp. CF079]SDC44470.1 TIR domain-containing protein [Variovorax sp. CF079]